MTARIHRLQSDVDAAAERLDAALGAVDGEVRDMRRVVSVLSPKLLLGVGLAAGFLFVALPRHLRGSTLLGLGRFAMNHLLPLLASKDET